MKNKNTIELSLNPDYTDFKLRLHKYTDEI